MHRLHIKGDERTWLSSHLSIRNIWYARWGRCVVGKINIEFRQDDAERLFKLMARDEFEMFLFRRDANPKITTALSAFFLIPPRPVALGEKARCIATAVAPSLLALYLARVGCAAYLRKLLFKFTRNFIVSEQSRPPTLNWRVFMCSCVLATMGSLKWEFPRSLTEQTEKYAFVVQKVSSFFCLQSLSEINFSCGDNAASVIISVLT